jgi:tol-pal system protein YbgF
VAALFCLLFLGGCATHKDVMGLEDRLAVAEEREKELQVKVEVLDSLLAEQNDLIYSMRAELKTGLESVTRGVEAVSEAVKYREPEGYTDILSPSQIPAPTRERLGPILEEPPREESPRVMEGALSQGAFPDRGTETSPPVAAAPGRELYDTAYLDMTRGNFELAMQGFEEYIASGQRAELKDNAQYWIGECFYAMGRFHEAIDAFQKVVDEYPRENKVPSALFKIGKCYFELGDKEEAQRYFQSVIGGYPQSEEANLAREYLADLR